MSNEQGTEASMCEIVGCTSPAVATRWFIDEERHLEVCYKHAEEGEPAREGN